MFDYFGHSVQNYGESLIFALIFNFRRLKLQRFFKRETMKCVKVKKYTHTTQFDFLLFCFNFYLSHSISVENFQLLCESKGTNTLLYISFADWTLLWTTFRYWNVLLFPESTHNSKSDQHAVLFSQQRLSTLWHKDQVLKNETLLSKVFEWMIL